MIFKLIESSNILREEYYYKVTYTYIDKDTGVSKKDYAYAIGPKDISNKDLLKMEPNQHEKTNDSILPDEYTIVNIVRLKDKKEVLKKTNKLYTLTNDQLRRKTRRTINSDAVIRNVLMPKYSFNGQRGADKLITHHTDGNEIITKDRRFIDAIPYNSNDSISKMLANTLHQLMERNLLSIKGKSVVYPVYIFNPIVGRYEIKDVEIKFK